MSKDTAVAAALLFGFGVVIGVMLEMMVQYLWGRRHRP